MLHAKGFGSRWINWIKCFLDGGKSQILVNEAVSNLTTSKRGLRQGDLLSPLLFVLAPGTFSRMLELAVQA